MAQQAPRKLLPGAAQVLHRRDAGAHPIAHRLVAIVLHPDRRQFARPVQAGRQHGVTTVGLDPVAGARGRLRRGDQVAVVAHLGQQAMDAVAAGAGFMAEMQRSVCLAQLRHRLADCRMRVRERAETAHLTPAPVLGDHNCNRFLVLVQTDECCILPMARLLLYGALLRAARAIPAMTRRRRATPKRTLGPSRARIRGLLPSVFRARTADRPQDPTWSRYAFTGHPQGHPLRISDGGETGLDCIDLAAPPRALRLRTQTMAGPSAPRLQRRSRHLRTAAPARFRGNPRNGRTRPASPCACGPARCDPRRRLRRFRSASPTVDDRPGSDRECAGWRHARRRDPDASRNHPPHARAS